MSLAATFARIPPQTLLRASIVVALVTIALKTLAWWITNSVGLLSDAMESLVNVASAVFALVMVRIAARPADHDHPYGHHKAEYFSSGFEGLLIIVAALVVFLVISAVRVVPQARRYNVERFGRYRATLQPGLNFIIPLADRINTKLDVREQVYSSQPKPVITEDNLVVNIDTVLYYQITDPRAAAYEVANYLQAIDQLTVYVVFATEAQLSMWRLKRHAAPIAKAQAEPVPTQEHEYTIDARERREGGIALDLRDRQPPMPGITFRNTDDLARPSQSILPALAPVLVRGQVHEAHQAACSAASSRVESASDSAQENPTMARPLWASRNTSSSPSGSRWR